MFGVVVLKGRAPFLLERVFYLLLLEVDQVACQLRLALSFIVSAWF